VRLILRSDFRDYYDHWFDSHLLYDGKAQVFERLSTGGMTRGEMLASMREHGLTVPAFGKPADLRSEKVVVYLDDHSHRGERKRVMDRGKAQLLYWNNLACEYLPGPPDSFRSLWIGRRSFALYYRSDDEWRSNVGDVKIRMCYEQLPEPAPLYDYPLWAIDFIYCEGEFYAVDLNIAPGLTGTPVEQLLKPGEVVELIKDWHINKGENDRVGQEVEE
jgi:hypothetical protein